MSRTTTGRSRPAITAALTLSLTGPYARQGNDAAEGVRLWAEDTGVQLTLVDDGGSRSAAVRAYSVWLHRGDVDLLLGPYASGLTRAVAPLARKAGHLLWNHGGSADDLVQPGIASLSTAASRYFDGAVDETKARGIGRMLVVQGAGPFARAVAQGAATRAEQQGLDVHVTDVGALSPEVGVAVLTAGRFEHDVEVVQCVRTWPHPPTLLAAVAAGIPAFGEELDASAIEGVLGPVHWLPNTQAPEIGPPGAEFAEAFLDRTHRRPSYVAAQVAAAGYLAYTAHSHGVRTAQLPGWRTSTLLGDFALDASWRQVGHRMTTIVWRDGRMVQP